MVRMTLQQCGVALGMFLLHTLSLSAADAAVFLDSTYIDVGKPAAQNNETHGPSPPVVEKVQLNFKATCEKQDANPWCTDVGEQPQHTNGCMSPVELNLQDPFILRWAGAARGVTSNPPVYNKLQDIAACMEHPSEEECRADEVHGCGWLKNPPKYVAVYGKGSCTVSNLSGILASVGMGMYFGGLEEKVAVVERPKYTQEDDECKNSSGSIGEQTLSGNDTKEGNSTETSGVYKWRKDGVPPLREHEQAACLKITDKQQCRETAGCEVCGGLRRNWFQFPDLPKDEDYKNRGFLCFNTTWTKNFCQSLNQVYPFPHKCPSSFKFEPAWDEDDNCSGQVSPTTAPTSSSSTASTRTRPTQPTTTSTTAATASPPSTGAAASGKAPTVVLALLLGTLALTSFIL